VEDQALWLGNDLESLRGFRILGSLAGSLGVFERLAYQTGDLHFQASVHVLGEPLPTPIGYRVTAGKGHGPPLLTGH
jgi:hypothetical protein